MEQQAPASLPTFSLYESITYGSLRPHLEDNTNIPSVAERYKRHILKRLNITDPAKEIRIGIELPPYLRFWDIALKDGDRLEITEVDKNTLDVKKVGHLISSGPQEVPSPYNAIGGYYLFLIEEEHEGFLQQLKRILFNDYINLKYNALVFNQCLQLYQQQAADYQQELLQFGYTNSTEHTPIYVLQVLSYYIYQQRQKVHKLFSPIVNSSLSPAEIAFNVLEAPEPIVPSGTTEQPAKRQQQTPTNNRIPKWENLFKDPNTADDIIAILKEDEIVASDNRWIQFPQLLTMVALYNVLLKKGYMIKANEKAEVLAVAFNKKFQVVYTSKKWQPKQRESAVYYEDLFRLIPEYKV